MDKPSIFRSTIYRQPTKEELIEVHESNLSSEDILKGFYYTMVGRGFLDDDNKAMIVDAVQRLWAMDPNNKEYLDALQKAKDLKSKYTTEGSVKSKLPEIIEELKVLGHTDLAEHILAKRDFGDTSFFHFCLSKGLDQLEEWEVVDYAYDDDTYNAPIFTDYIDDYGAKPWTKINQDKLRKRIKEIAEWTVQERSLPLAKKALALVPQFVNLKIKQLAPMWDTYLEDETTGAVGSENPKCPNCGSDQHVSRMGKKYYCGECDKLFGGHYTPAQIKKWFAKLSDEKKDELLKQVSPRYQYKESEKSLLQKILRLCKQIVRHDVDFENKNTEIDRAEQTANTIQKEYDELLALVEQVDPKDAALVKDMLEVLNHPWMRVLGDRLKYKDNLEQKLKDLPKHVSLQKKLDIDNLYKDFEKFEIPVDQNIDEWMEYYAKY